MEANTPPPKRHWVIGVAATPSGGDKPGINDFLPHELERINLEGLPMCRMHDPQNIPGKWVNCIPTKDGPLLIGYVDEKDAQSSMVVKELKSGYLKELSMNHFVWAYKDGEDNNKMNILKLPMEVSLVDKGLRNNCRILGVCSEDEVDMDKQAPPTNQAAPSQPANKPPVATQAQPTSQTSTQAAAPTPMEITPPQPMPIDAQMDLQNLNEDALKKADHNQLVQLTVLLGKKVTEMNEDVSKFGEYKEYLDKKKVEEIEAMKQDVFASMRDHKGEEYAKQFTQSIDGLFGNKSFKTLDTDGRVFKAVMANAKHWHEENQRNLKELETLKGQKPGQDDYTSALMKKVANYGPARTSSATPTAQRFDPYAVAQAEKKVATPPAIDPNSQKTSAPQVPYALPQEGTALYNSALKDPKTYHQLQMASGGDPNPLLNRLMGHLRGPPRTMQKQQ